MRYRFDFRTQVRNPDSFLYALPGVARSAIRSSTSSRPTPRPRAVEEGPGGRREGRRPRPAGRPANTGPKTIPDYGKVAAEANRTLDGGGKVFAGPVDDPFFVDLGTTFDAINIRKGTGAEGGGRDDVAGYNVHSIVLQVPEAHVTRDGRPVADMKAPNAVVGVWASTERPRRTVLAAGARRSHGDVQVSRLGNPLINEVVIPLGQKDKFNATAPKDDLANFGKYVLSPELAKVINILFPGLNVNEPHGHRDGTAHGRAGSDADR